jgi:hypothetical protein
LPLAIEIEVSEKGHLMNITLLQNIINVAQVYLPDFDADDFISNAMESVGNEILIVLKNEGIPLAKKYDNDVLKNMILSALEH